MSKPEEPIHQRLNFLIDKLEDGVQRRFAQRLGISSGAIGDILGQRKSKPGFDLLGKILRAYSQIRAEWLLLGEGEMLKSAEAPKNNSVSSDPAPRVEEESQAPYLKAERGGRLEILTVQVGPDGEENIEVVNTRVAAGYPQNRIEPEYISKLPSFRLPGAPYNSGSFRCFQVSGDSMEPTLQDGDWLICRAVENWGRDMRDNRVYVVVTEDDLTVKRVLNQFNERGQITLQSDNRGYGVRFLDGNLVGEVWEGVARLTRNLAAPRVDVPDELARHRADLAEIFERLNRLESGKNPSGEE